jgi:AraC family transcriptional regulator, regulatory protein of adaptative response / methylated-DNA-[protein]-cysteine methyltransferase
LPRLKTFPGAVFDRKIQTQSIKSGLPLLRPGGQPKVTNMERKTMTEEAMWRAVEARDASVDGRFYVAVRTTGVYCRPSCPSKHAKRENITFYPTPEAAEAAGYRPCLRCKPRESDAPQLAWVKKACDYIRRNEGEKITLDDLTSEIGVSAAHLQRTFKHVMGLTPRQYQEACRVERLKQKLKQGEPVTKAVYGVGYGSTSWLYKDANAKLGMTPGAYRRAGEGMKIRYRVVDSPLGRLLVARTSYGVCHLSLGDSDAMQEEALRREYPKAEITQEEGKPDPWTLEVIDYLAGRATKLGDIPVDVTGTDFQQRVWRELQSIPRGSIRSYEDVARSIGQPTAARAVSRACATNLVSLIIPCHRVVRKSGGLGGYKWGIERKRRLLESESAPHD